MRDFVLPDREPPALYVHLVPTEQQASSPGVLALETLEHGAYYAGKVGATPTVARWHGKKRRFVFGQFSLGQQRLRSLAHIADSDKGTEERFIPLSKPEPKDSYRVSDYAFETAG